MEEYLIKKCPTCGQEQRGPKIIRVSAYNKKEWDTIGKSYRRKKDFWGGLVYLSYIAPLIGAFVAGVGIQIKLPFGAIALFILPFFLILGMGIWQTQKNAAIFHGKQREILSQYGVSVERKIEGVDYVVHEERVSRNEPGGGDRDAKGL